MNIHSQFTFLHFLLIGIILLIANVVFQKFKRRKFKEIFNLWMIIPAFLITILTAFYQEKFCSGMYCGTRYGFPRQIFDMAHYIGKDQVDVRVISKMHWDYLFQNFLLIFLFLNIIKNIFTNNKNLL